jgi:hypothetical protein
MTALLFGRCGGKLVLQGGDIFVLDCLADASQQCSSCDEVIACLYALNSNYKTNVIHALLSHSLHGYADTHFDGAMHEYFEYFIVSSHESPRLTPPQGFVERDDEVNMDVDAKSDFVLIDNTYSRMPMNW